MTTTASESVEQQLRAWHRNIPDLFHGAFRRTWLKAMQRRSMKAAIRAKCQDCMCWQNAEIRECPIVHCPLFPYRPGSKKDGDRETFIREVAAGLDAGAD